MPPTTAARLLTAEEFAELPNPIDDSQQELVKGVIVVVPPPSFYHGVCCVEISSRMADHVRETRSGFVTGNDSGVVLARDPDTVRGPDVAYWSRERLPEPPRKGYPSVAPDLAVEVLSPSDVFTKVQQKVRDYLDAGVQLVWVLVPEDRSVAVFRKDRTPDILNNGDMLTGGDVLPGFSCPVADLFP